MVSSPGAGKVHFHQKWENTNIPPNLEDFHLFERKSELFRPRAANLALANGFIGVFGGQIWWKSTFLGHFPEKVRKSPKCGENHKIMDFTSSGPPKHLLNHWLEHRFQPGAGKCTFSPENRKNTIISWKSAFFLSKPIFSEQAKKHLN